MFATFTQKSGMLSKDLYMDGSVQDWSNSVADALELLQFCT